VNPERPTKAPEGKLPVLISCTAALIGLLAALVWCLLSGASFTLGKTHYHLFIGSISGLSSSANYNPKQKVFLNIGWDDPGGQITHGRMYGLRIGSRVLELDTYYSPKGFPRPTR
jgi:hypothetical protein